MARKGYNSAGGGAAGKFVQIPSALLASPTGDPNSLFDAARNESDGWVEVDYNDGVGAYAFANQGARFDLGDIPSALGPAYASMKAGDYLFLAVELDKSNLNPYQLVSLLWSSENTLAAGSHVGVTCGVSAGGNPYGRVIRAGATEAGTTDDADANLARVRFISDGTGLRAKDVQTFDTSDPGTVLQYDDSLSLVAGYSAQDRLVLSVHTQSAAGGSSVNTARFRLRCFALSAADLYAIGG